MKDEEKTRGQLIAELKTLRLQNEKIMQEADRLRSSEERCRNFVENAVDGCAEYNLSGMCTFCNEATGRIFGYPRAKLLKIRHHERYPDSEEARKVFSALHETYGKNLLVNYVDAFIQKPFQLSDLSKMIREVLDNQPGE